MDDGHIAQAASSAPANAAACDGAIHQPPLDITLHAALGSLALGGAERIVLDWARSAAARHRVRLVVLRDTPAAWPAPSGIDIVRLRADLPLAAQLRHEGRVIASSGNPRVLCHLLKREERDALEQGGALPVSVVHNAREGWIDKGIDDHRGREVLAVSNAAASELRALGAHATVLRYFPRTSSAPLDERTRWRACWDVPEDAPCIGMIGGVKPQKAYPQAIRVLAALRAKQDAYLVILGGPIGRDGLQAWRAVLAQALRLGVADYVRLPGFTAHAARALSAFDLLLNTSRYEGVSIATLEALAAGLSVVATAVGGQAELPCPGLRLLAHDAAPAAWVETIRTSLSQRASPPPWLGFPSPRLWSLFHIPLPEQRGRRTVFVTANLNVGGAQRSLVNLAKALHTEMPIEIAVCGESSAEDFTRALQAAGVSVYRTACGRDCFDHAEALLLQIARTDIGRIVFWNVDPKVKLLLSKRLAGSPIRLIDVSPGAYAFEEMDATAVFQTCIAHDSCAYYARLDRLVLKYRSMAPPGASVAVIPNGVAIPTNVRCRTDAPRRIVVSGRIAPSKFLLEILGAMRLVWSTIPDAELHLIGRAERRHHDYCERVFEAVGGELGRRVFAHGAPFDVPNRLAQYDIALVIGHHQGSPNAVLEAMAARLAVVANDSGGTNELVIDGRTGVLLADREPRTIACGLLRLLHDAGLSERLARAGHDRVRTHFSLAHMVGAYRRILAH